MTQGLDSLDSLTSLEMSEGQCPLKHMGCYTAGVEWHIVGETAITENLRAWIMQMIQTRPMFHFDLLLRLGFLTLTIFLSLRAFFHLVVTENRLYLVMKNKLTKTQET